MRRASSSFSNQRIGDETDVDETDQVRGPAIERERSGSLAIFLAGGGAGLMLGLVVGLLCARSVAAAVRSLRRRMAPDGEPHFEFLAQ
jgi:hypothetical protein